MNKTFPKSRICVIDAYPSFAKGLTKAFEFATKHNIRLNSTDGKKLILSFCLKTINEDFKSTSSSFPKVLCISKKNISRKLEGFISIYFDKLIQYLPIPYCGKYDLDSPDLEFAAETCLEKTKPQQRYKGFVSSLNIKK